MNNGAVLGLGFREGGRGGGVSATPVSHPLVTMLRNLTGRPWVGMEGLFSLEMSGSEVKPLTNYPL